MYTWLFYVVNYILFIPDVSLPATTVATYLLAGRIAFQSIRKGSVKQANCNDY